MTLTASDSPVAAGSPLLSVQGLCCERDGRPLFDGLSFALNAGCAIQVMGANGAGKSTLIRTLIGSVSDFRGEIHWRGQAFPAGLPSMRAELLYIGHNAGVRRGLTPLENLAWYGATEKEAFEALAAVGLFGFEDLLCRQLSAGQNRRVALARLYLPDPAPLWVLDEPLAALDVAGVESLEARMRAHLENDGSLLLTSHQPVNIPALSRIDLADVQAPCEDRFDDAAALAGQVRGTACEVHHG
ncbi:cytochrome c biogenesis heme-transporting ATPase CcmA [Microbulbifer elongatus]|uniref:Cytochrome c biogenesis heme-transporting ATPase CcmA n=1 Tax=Microbulbifer elongatus TaxID=86173 RepID=A0ABT1P2Y9_9GAMM|nr:cytochrome c biogenesis heme-transporting ATPase CcmA [Microbulbifer elongatus]MCQ3830488.1 cytochrome c biogenesis heme-transporting ATPase CcmA [Microbulbifer elongatus]